MGGPSSDNGTLTRQTLHGAKWTYVAMFVNAGFQVFIVAALARLVVPSAFGLIAMATLVLRFGQYFANMGVGQAIVQRGSLSREHASAGFWTSVGIGTLFWGLVWLLAPLATRFFHSPGLTPVLEVMGAGFFLTGTSTAAFGLLRRGMRFRAIAISDVCTYAVSYAGVGVIVALLGGEVWSLVAASLCQALLTSVIYNLLARPRIVPVMTWGPYRELLGFGSAVSLISFLEFLNSNLDTIVVGRTAGAGSLGYYSRSLNLTGLPMQYLSTSLSKVLLPSFARIQDDLARVGRAYITLLTVFASLGLPIALGMSGAATEIVRVLLGPDWSAAVPVVRIVAVASCAAMLSHFGGVALEATAHLRDKLALRGGQLAVFACALLALSRFGLVGFASAFALSELTLHVALVIRAARLFGVPLAQVKAAYWPGMATGVLCWAALFGESALGSAAGLPALAVLAVQLVTGVTLVFSVAMRAGHGRLYRLLQQRLTDGGQQDGWGRALARLAWLSGQRAAKPEGTA